MAFVRVWSTSCQLSVRFWTKGCWLDFKVFTLGFFSSIDSCIKANDLQTAVMIVAMLKQHDMKLVPNKTSVDRTSHLKKANKVRIHHGNRRHAMLRNFEVSVFKMTDYFTLYDSSNNSSLNGRPEKRS